MISDIVCDRKKNQDKSNEYYNFVFSKNKIYKKNDC